MFTNLLALITLFLRASLTVSAWMNINHHHRISTTHRPSFGSKSQPATTSQRYGSDCDPNDQLLVSDGSNHGVMTTRRDTFGAMLGSVLLPPIIISQAADAVVVKTDDDFPFKVRILSLV
jgi:hypothetical protein